MSRFSRVAVLCCVMPEGLQAAEEVCLMIRARQGLSKWQTCHAAQPVRPRCCSKISLQTHVQVLRTFKGCHGLTVMAHNSRAGSTDHARRARSLLLLRAHDGHCSRQRIHSTCLTVFNMTESGFLHTTIQRANLCCLPSFLSDMCMC